MAEDPKKAEEIKEQPGKDR